MTHTEETETELGWETAQNLHALRTESKKRQTNTIKTPPTCVN